LNKTKVEYHCHTSASHDCEVHILNRINTYANNGFTHLAITDHDVVFKKAKFEKINRNIPQVLNIICGIEISTVCGHVILYNCSYKPKFNALWFLVIWSWIFNCEISIPHPCRSGTGLLQVYSTRGFGEKYLIWFLKKAKYLEVANYRDSPSLVAVLSQKVIDICRSKVFISGSDAHFEDDIDLTGCPLTGYDHSDLVVTNFFKYNLIVGDRKTHFSVKSIWIMIKWNARYFLKGF
jgi:hypothetical protein